MISDPESLGQLTVPELLTSYARVLTELEKREVVRTRNAPAGDYAEWLCARSLGGTLAPNSAKSYDLVLDDGTTVQVKCRVVSDPIKSGERQASVFRSWDFDLAAFVLFSRADYSVVRAVLLPAEVVRQAASAVSHVNGHRVVLSEALLHHADAVDITESLRNGAGS